MSRFVFFAMTALLLTLGSNTQASPTLRPAASNDLVKISQSTQLVPQVVSVRTNGLPSLVVGRLSKPSQGLPVDIAKAFIKRSPGLFPSGVLGFTVVRTQAHAMGATVRLQQLHRGVPVLGADAALIVDRDGIVRAVSNGFIELGDLDTTANVSDIDASDIALGAARWFVPSDTQGFYSRLVILPVHGSFGVLAWELHYGAIPGLMSNMWFYVDAKTGAVLRQENRIQNYNGLAFETNPGPSNDRKVPIEVPLSVPEGGMDYTGSEYDEEIVATIKTACDYPETPEAQPDCPAGDPIWLRHPLHMTRNCVDYHELIPLDLSSMGIPGNFQAHFCSEIQTASADENGDFFFDDWKDEDGEFYDLNPTDKFAEVQMFYHVQSIYDYFLNLMDDYEGTGTAEDWAGHDMKPLIATVNFKLPINMNDPGAFTDFAGLLESLSDPNSELYPFDNAMFMPGGPGMPGLSRPNDSIIFGQGTLVDYSWDGDVIYHEFTHSLDNSVTNGGTGQYTEFADEWGINPEPGGMSEGFADTFPAFVTNEPTMGEYSLGSQARDLTGAETCPHNLVGEVHYDSPMWSQSNYQGREAAVAAVAGTLSETEARHLYEQATFVGLSSVVGEQGYGVTAAAILVAVEDLMGTAAKEAAAAVYAAHHTDDCPRVFSDDGEGEIEHTTYMLGIAAPNTIRYAATPKPYTPGLMQYEITVPEGSRALNLAMTVTADQTAGLFGGEAGEPDMKVIVRHGSAIQFTYQGSKVITDDDVMGPYAMDSQSRFSLVGESGGNLEAGKYYVMAVNAGTGRGSLHDPELYSGEPIADDAGVHVYGSESEVPDPEDTDTTAGTDEETDTESPTTDDSTDDGDTDEPSSSQDNGCGCATAGKDAGFSLLRLLASTIGL